MPWNAKETLVMVARSRFTLAVLAGCAVLLWLRYVPPESPWSPRRIVGAVMPEPREIVRIEKVTVPGPARIKVIPKEVIVERWRDLPTPATVADNASVVTAVADIPPSPAGGTAVSILRTVDNVATGSIEYQAKAVPFWQLKKEFGVRAGMGTSGLIVGEVYVHPMRVGPVHIEGRGFIKRDDAHGADFGAAVLLDYRF